MNQSQNFSGNYSFKKELLPQPEMLEEKKGKRILSVGIPKELDKYENRIILTPQAVRQLTEEGHNIQIESGAGVKSRWKDTDYKAAGAIIKSRKDIYKSEIILKVSPFEIEDIKLMTGNQMVISALHLNTQNLEKISQLKFKKITAVSIELMENQEGFNSFVQTMNEIAGIMAVNIAGEYLCRTETGKGILLGGITGIPASKVIILGAGTAGEYAAGTGLGLGAQIKIFDSSLQKLQRLKNKFGIQLFTSILQKEVIIKALKTADVVIAALDEPNEDNRVLITEKMVTSMKKGSVIIDLNTDSGSYISTSQVTHLENPAYEKHGIIHYCVPNIASKAPRTASVALSNTIFPILQKICHEKNTHDMIRNIPEIRNGTYIYEGILTNDRLAKKFNLDYKDIELLTTFF